MQKNKYLFIAILVATTIWGCKNDLNVLAPYKSIPIVYGLMDQSDTAHYIRLNKSFLGNGNAFTMAQQFDSIYYPRKDITVQIQDVNTYGIVATVTLTPDSSIPVAPGTFSYPKQILYKTKYTLNPYDTYNLIVTDERTGKLLTSGSTTLLTDVAFGGNFATIPNIPMSFFETAPSTISWSNVQNGRIYQMTFRFFYYDSLPSTHGVEKYIDWVFPAQTSSSLQAGSVTMVYNYTGQGFLQFVKNSIPVIAGAYRRADSIGVIFTTGSDDLNTYIQLSQPSLGINQDPPTFSDVKNGVGIYSARHTQNFKKSFSATVRDSIVMNALTAPLNFH